MKKRFLLLSVVLALVLVLAGCSKPTMNVEPQDDGSLSITCDRMYGSGVSADITVAEGQTLVFTPALEKGTIYVRIMAPATDINKLPDVENDEAYFEGAFLRRRRRPSGCGTGRVFAVHLHQGRQDHRHHDHRSHCCGRNGCTAGTGRGSCSKLRLI